MSTNWPGLTSWSRTHAIALASSREASTSSGTRHISMNLWLKASILPSLLTTSIPSAVASKAARMSECACSRASSARLRSVRSCATPRYPVTAPSSPFNGVMVSRTGNRLPSLRTYVHSRSSARPVRASATSASKPGRTSRPSWRLSSAARASISSATWMSIGVVRPTISLAA